MKPNNHPLAKTNTPASEPHNNFPVGPQRVAIEFLPQFDWSIEVGTPWPSTRARRNNPIPAHDTDCCALGLAPIELVIDAAKKKKARRNWDRREPLWVGSLIN